ncbi:MAG TPA: hypothetical protein VG815_15835 [Chloroflexota bacterium]|nr:hypothetical protein [Chloroflexota bacterium]
MRRIRIAAAAVVVAALICTPIVTSGASRPHSRFAGKWSYIVEQACTPSPTLDPKNICGQILGNYGGSWSNWLEATATATGNLTFQAGFVSTDDDAAAPHFCNIKIFTVNFDGSCLVTDHGRGFIKRDKTGTPYLWISGETATFHGNQQTVKHDPSGTYPFQNQMLVPGVYDTTQNLRAAGMIGPSDTPPPNVSWDVTVTHTK